MLITIELRDTSARGRRLGGSRVYMSHCRAIRQAGDGVRMDNLAASLQKFYHSMTVALLQKDPGNPDVGQVDKGTYPVIAANLERFLSAPEGGAE